MSLMASGRQKLAVLSGMVFALILSDCATQSNPGVPAPNTPSVMSGKKTFEYTGGKQLFTVPAGVNKVTITADGASGANSTSGDYAGGLGGLVTATVTVAPHEVLAIFVGGSGGDGGFNGGGASAGSGSETSSVGGGASDVRSDRTGQRMLDAGGGGGAGASSGSNYYGSRSPAPTSGSPYGSGGNGGSSKGANGRTGSNGSYETVGGDGGRGGTLTAGGNGGSGGSGGGGSSCAGKSGDGGTRYNGGSGGGGCYAGGGGGGGGYYGGGGGGGADGRCGRTYYGEYGYCAWGGGGGGGGGSSFIEKTATTIKNIKGGAPAGDGRVVISW